MTALLPLKLARPHEIPLLKSAGYEVAGSWDGSFTLMRFARETEAMVEAHNARTLEQIRDRDAWRDTVEPNSRRFREPRELGAVPIDADAEQLAGDVGALADELRRVGW